MAIASINHIDVDEHCVARIAGTRLKVHILIAVMNANGYTAEQMMEGYPSLSKAQVYAMLAYYHDHKEEIDALNERIARETDELARQSRKENPELYRKLRSALENKRREQQWT